LRHIREVKKQLKVTTMNNNNKDDDENKVDERNAMNELGLQQARHFGWSNTCMFTKAMGEVLLGLLVRIWMLIA
jgi:fatty acyl-CoA reductase